MTKRATKGDEKSARWADAHIRSGCLFLLRGENSLTTRSEFGQGGTAWRLRV